MPNYNNKNFNLEERTAKFGENIIIFAKKNAKKYNNYSNNKSIN